MNISAKIQALLSKTVENGATEEEALAAAAKAQELLERYQLTLDRVQLEAEGCIRAASPLHETASGYKLRRSDDMKFRLLLTVSRFAHVKGWRSRDKGVIELFGLRSDVEFALWLLDSLAHFVDMKATFDLVIEGYVGAAYTEARRSYIDGAAGRMNERLKAAVGDAHNALVVTKDEIINPAFADLGVHLVNTRLATAWNPAAFAAGAATGAAASFARPVGAAKLRITGR